MKKEKTVFLFLVGLFICMVVVLSLVFVLSNSEDKDLDDREREKIGGAFIKLSAGYTHYELAGPDSGKAVLLIHGGGPSLWVWDRQVNMLHDAGFRTLRFDRYGTGYSDRIKGDYNWDLLIGQITDLLDALQIIEPLYVAVRSLGGRAAACFAVKNPERVEKLVIISTSLLTPGGKIIGKIPFISYIPRFIKRVFGNALTKNMMQKYETYIHSAEEKERYTFLLMDQVRYKGTEEAFGAIFKDQAYLGCKNVFGKVASGNYNVAMIWGENDPLVSAKRIESLKETYTHIQFTKISEAEHGVNFTHAKEFNEALLSFLNKENISGK